MYAGFSPCFHELRCPRKALFLNVYISLCSTKHLKYARAYIDFNKSDDVIEFAEVFKGHVFVNEKGNV